ncbi:MAG: SurA N-terminal domain-containing protein, partial [Proteobacteria bacterium]|nr:SurA N-terminal domain-containing protein [Pseudomonadota bacterium]
MLQNIRERSQGIVAWAIILLVSLTFVLWGVQDYISHLGSNTDRVKVNGIEIS